MPKSYIEVKRKLCNMNLKYMLLYQAKLKVILQGKSHLFECPEEVWTWLGMWDQIPVKNWSSEDPFYKRTREEARGRNRGSWRGRGRCRDEHRLVVREDGTIDTASDKTVLVPDTT